MSEGSIEGGDEHSRIRDILLIRFSTLGDIILTTGVIETLAQKFPNTNLYYLTKEHFKGLFSGDDRLKEVFTLGENESLLGIYKRLKNRHFDVVFDLHGVAKSYIISCLLQVPVLRTRKRSFARRIMTFIGRKWVGNSNVLVQYKLLLERFGCECDVIPRLIPSNESMMWVRNLLREHGFREKEFAVIAPGARYPTKQWTKEGFAGVADWLSGERKLPIVFLGDNNDIPFVKSITELMVDKSLNLSGLATIEQAVALLANACLFVTNDSGLMHMGHALNIPFGVVFGPTHPALGFMCDGPGRIIFTTDEPCSPCSLHGEKPCKKPQRKCMEDIKVDVVIDGLGKLLDTSEK